MVTKLLTKVCSVDILKAMGVGRSGASPREFDGAGDRGMFGEKQSGADQAVFASRFAELQQHRESQRNPATAKPGRESALRQDGAHEGFVEANAQDESFADAATLTVDGAPEEALEDIAGAAHDTEPGDADPSEPVPEDARSVAAVVEIALGAGLDADTVAGEDAVGEVDAATDVETGSGMVAQSVEAGEAVAENPRTANAPASSPAPAAVAIAPFMDETGASEDTARPVDARPSTSVPAESPLPSVNPQKAMLKVTGAATTQPISVEAPESADAEPADAAVEILTAAEKKSVVDGAPKTEALIVSQGGIKLAQDALASPIPMSERPLQADASIRLETAKPNAASQARFDAPEAARQIFASIRADKGGGVDLRLDPPDLGRVRIQFSFERSDVVVATVSSERGETLDLLRRHSADLARELQRAGFENVTLEFASGESRSSPLRESHAASSDFDLGDDIIDAPSIVYVSARADNRLDRLV